MVLHRIEIVSDPLISRRHAVSPLKQTDRGHVPVLHSDVFARLDILVAGNITNRKHIASDQTFAADPEELVRLDRTILLELHARVLEQLGRRLDSDAHNDEVGFNRLSVLELDGTDLS